MQCTLTADTPSWLLMLVIALGAVAVGLCAEVGAVGMALRWRSLLARWGWGLVLPLAFALWCVVCAAQLWQLDQALLAPGENSMSALIEYCGSLSSRPATGEVTLALGLLLVAAGIVFLFVFPSRVRAPKRAPVWPTGEALGAVLAPTTSPAIAHHVGHLPAATHLASSRGTRSDYGSDYGSDGTPGYARVASGSSRAHPTPASARRGDSGAFWNTNTGTNPGLAAVLTPRASTATEPDTSGASGTVGTSGAYPVFAPPAEPTQPLYPGIASEPVPLLPALPPLPERTPTVANAPIDPVTIPSLYAPSHSVTPTVPRVPHNPFGPIGIEAAPTQTLAPAGA